MVAGGRPALQLRHFFDLPLFATDHTGLHVPRTLSRFLKLGSRCREGEDRTPTQAPPAQGPWGLTLLYWQGRSTAFLRCDKLRHRSVSLRCKSVILFLSLYTKNEADSEADI